MHKNGEELQDWVVKKPWLRILGLLFLLITPFAWAIESMWIERKTLIETLKECWAIMVGDFDPENDEDA